MTAALLEPPVPLQEAPPILSLDSEALFEIVDGEKVKLSPMSMESAILSNRLGSKVTLFVDQKDLAKFILKPLSS